MPDHQRSATPRQTLAQVADADLRSLRVFKAVVDSGGFSNAEVTLNISRSAISITMSDLEKRLGLKLCQRGRAGFALTEEGKSVYQSSLQLLNSIETFRTQVNSLHNQLRGELTVGITDNLVTLDHMNVTHAFAQLKKEHPEVNVQIRMMPPPDIERQILDGSLHLGIVPSIRELSGVAAIALYEEQSYLYCSNQHPLFSVKEPTVAEVIGWDAIAESSVQPMDSLVSYQRLKTTATSNNREGIAFLILTGRYIGFLPDHFARQWQSQNRLKAILPDQFNYQTKFQIITRSGSGDNRLRDYFVDLLTR